MWLPRGRWVERGIDWEFGLGRCKPLHLEWINNKVLLCSTRNYNQYPVINHNGKEKINKLEFVFELQKKKKKEIDNNIIIVGDFNTPLTSTEKSSRQKINKETVLLSEILNQLDLIDNYSTFHQKNRIHILFI